MDLIQRRRSLLMPQNSGGGNLLKLDVPFQNPDNTDVANTSKRIFTPSTYCLGASWSNYFAPRNVTSYTISESRITATTRGGGYGVGFPIRVKPGKTYKFSCSVSSITATSVNKCFYAADGTLVDKSSASIKNKEITIPSGVNIIVIIFYTTGTEQWFENIEFVEV